MFAHRLNQPYMRAMWQWPLPLGDPRTRLIPELVRHGVTHLMPQASDDAVAWTRTWGAKCVAAGMPVVIGLGRISASVVLKSLDEIDAGRAVGTMIDQEAWESVADSNALVTEVLAERPDAPQYIVDCHYPCVVSLPGGGPNGHGHTGHDRIARAWGPLCGLRAPQDYDEEGWTPDGFVTARAAWSRHPSQYPSIGSPAETVRVSCQLYRRSVNDHVRLLGDEGATGSVFLWDWREADASAKVALRVVYELGVRGFRGPGAVQAFQQSATLTADGLVGPKTCKALGVEVPAGVVWTRP
jgi:hypothetical protein